MRKTASQNRPRFPRAKAKSPNQEQIAAILESITDGFFALDGQWRFTYVNEEAERLLQRKRCDLLGRVLWEAFPESLAFRQQAETAMACHQPIHSCIGPFRGGWIEVHAYPSVQGISVYFSDITERMRAEESLRLSEERLRLALEAADSGMWEWDLATGQHVWSEELWKLYGLEPQSCEPCYDTWLAAIHPEDREAARHCIAEAARQGTEFFLEHRVLSPDGAVRWLVSRGRLIGRSGQASRVIGIVMDVTESKRTEATLRATEKFAAAGRLAATLAHEINNPMAAVMNLLFLLAENPSLDAEARNYVNLGQQEVARVAHITQQMLGFYRETHHPVPVKLAALLDGVLELYAHRLNHALVQVQTEYEFQEEIESFPSDLRQVFSNLLANALDAMESGGALRIRVKRAREWSKTGRQGIQILLADTGPGIPGHCRPHVFDAFFTTKGERGTGLGLWVSRGIIEKLGGAIRMRSSARPGASGTCFSIFLPAKGDALAAEQNS
jgi:PAS domain S-box-containing protein